MPPPPSPPLSPGACKGTLFIHQAPATTSDDRPQLKRARLNKAHRQDQNDAIDSAVEGQEKMERVRQPLGVIDGNIFNPAGSNNKGYGGIIPASESKSYDDEENEGSLRARPSNDNGMNSDDDRHQSKRVRLNKARHRDRNDKSSGDVEDEGSLRAGPDDKEDEGSLRAGPSGDNGMSSDDDMSEVEYSEAEDSEDLQSEADDIAHLPAVNDDPKQEDIRVLDERRRLADIAEAHRAKPSLAET
ncbi:hypothetical protein N7466_003049 [Penicillium verhagenii]|uniref:uncharacterized protein n=1 Tax=Penicillium verhagenii TaxID=1562060 RepID=UPI0025456AE8|nr:uncharacterized protein N7466_003049 [Penicillium verhagenii]KAJ5936599.1 hypothetical protein N7466_003049 [Penicillium verhagenii]